MTFSRTTFSRMLAVGFIVAMPALVQAHMKLEKSDPVAGAVLVAPPPHIQLFFSEAPDLTVSKLEIKGPSDKTQLVNMHAMGKSLMAIVQGDMPDGAYTVLWQSAGDDGHVQKGELAFTVKRK